MGWADLKTDLLAEWARLSGPGFYLYAGLIAAALADLAARALALRRDHRLHGQTRLKRAEERWSVFESTLPGMSPADAAARIRRLESYVAQLPPRRLDDKQKKMIAAAGCPPAEAPYLAIVHEAASAEADRFARDLVEAFSAAPGWNVVDEPHPMGARALSAGLAVGLVDPDNPTPTEQLVLMALRDAKVTFDVVARAAEGADAQVIVSTR